MGIATTMREYLEDSHVPYDIVMHNRTSNSTMTARVSHVSPYALAKGVVLKWDGGYMLAVLPASRQVDLKKVREIVGEDVKLASEEETAALFPDCAEGAVPILGAPYHLACVMDEGLEATDDIYFEGGDHRTLVHVSHDGFDRLMYGMPRGQIAG